MLNIMERRKIRKLKSDGMSQAAIAEQYGVDQATISRALDDRDNDSRKADRMEAFGLVVRDDGCYVTGMLGDTKTIDHEYVLPNHEVDWNTPEAMLEAEQEIEERLRNGQLEE